jgi:hypothetical protein
MQIHPVSAELAKTDPFEDGRFNCTMDQCENAPFGSTGGPSKRDHMTAPEWVRPENTQRWLAGYRARALEMYGEDWETCAFGWVAALEFNRDGVRVVEQE